jgi:hypothetical protein
MSYLACGILLSQVEQTKTKLAPVVGNCATNTSNSEMTLELFWATAGEMQEERNDGKTEMLIKREAEF